MAFCWAVGLLMGKAHNYLSLPAKMQGCSAAGRLKWCPPDSEAWRVQSFDLTAHKGQIEGIIADNSFMAELQSRIVPLIVEYGVFWTRYFYRLHGLQLKHQQRQQLAQRAQQVCAVLRCAVLC